MSFYALSIFIFIQYLLSNECLCDVENTLRGKILFSNQDIIEENHEFVSRNKETILSRDEIFNFLSGIVSTAQDVEKLKELFGYLGPKELRHIDFLMYLMRYYQHSQPTFLKAIIEILTEHEIALNNIMRNLGMPQYPQ
ncbi:hypothetical protein ACKWTF_007908 [Chironomus riparius]